MAKEPLETQPADPESIAELHHARETVLARRMVEANGITMMTLAQVRQAIHDIFQPFVGSTAIPTETELWRLIDGELPKALAKCTKKEMPLLPGEDYMAVMKRLIKEGVVRDYLPGDDDVKGRYLVMLETGRGLSNYINGWLPVAGVNSNVAEPNWEFIQHNGGFVSLPQGGKVCIDVVMLGLTFAGEEPWSEWRVWCSDTDKPRYLGHIIHGKDPGDNSYHPWPAMLQVVKAHAAFKDAVLSLA